MEASYSKLSIFQKDTSNHCKYIVKHCDNPNITTILAITGSYKSLEYFK